MPMQTQMEKAQLLARFKLQVRRSLAQTVDLESLSGNPTYAKQRLAEIEDAAQDEELLVMVLLVREMLAPVIVAPEVKPVVKAEVKPEVKPKVIPEPLPVPPSALIDSAPKESRKHLMGARGW